MDQRGRVKGLRPFGWIITGAAGELGRPLIPFEEVHRKWLAKNALKRNDGLRYAASQPVYFDRAENPE